jgi:AraC-like DNA-binding protein
MAAVSWSAYDDDAEAAACVVRVDPPYIEPGRPLGALEIEQGFEFRRGTLLLQEVGATSHARASLALTKKLRQRFPAVPMLVRIPRSAGSGTFRLAVDLCRFGCHPVLHDTGPLAPALRDSLTNQTELASRLCDWLQHTSIVTCPEVLAFIRAVTEAACERRSVEDAARVVRQEPRRVRARCARLGLPSPVRWRTLARLLHDLATIQRSPHLSCARHAYELGYGDQQAMCHIFRARLGCTPSEVKELLGWEWIVCRWLAIHRFVANRRGAALS